MADDKGKDILRRYESLKAVRADYEDLWQYIIDYVCPRRYNLDGTKTKGIKVGEMMFDATAPDALGMLSAGLYGYLVSPAIRWFRLRMSRYGLDDIPEVAAWLEAVEEVMYWSFGRSNFYSEIYEYFQDGGSIGTATIYSERDEKSGKIVFTTCNPGEIFIACNRHGLVDTVYRRYKLSARKAVQSFEGGKLPEAVTRAATDEKDTEHEYLHAVFPRDDVQMYFDRGDLRPTLGVKGMPFESVTLCMDSGNAVVRESGYRSLPFAVWRWRTNSEEDYGRSPASDAIVDVLGANQMGRTLLLAGQMAVEPPLNVPEELRGKVRIRPRGMNYYDSRERMISAIQVTGQYPISKEREDDKRQAIRSHFMTDFFTLLSQAAMQGRELTVPQVLEMQGEKAAMLGPIIGRLSGEALNPIIDRVFMLESEAGNIPPPPEVLMQFGGQDIDVDYMGPLAQAQRRLFKTQGVAQSISAMTPIAGVRPEVLDIVDFDEVTREILEANGMPTKAIRPPVKVDEIRKARQDAQARAEQAAMVDKAAQHLPALTRSVEPNSVLEQLVGASGGGARQ